MGCTSSNSTQTDLEKLVKKQTNEISNLKQTNQELKSILERILAENERAKAVDKTEGVQRKITELEGKVLELEEKLKAKEGSDDTFSRGSVADSPPDILYESKKQEDASQIDVRASNSILDDPAVREMYERKRAMFMRHQPRPPGDQDSQAVISPTMTSTTKTNQ